MALYSFWKVNLQSLDLRGHYAFEFWQGSVPQICNQDAVPVNMLTSLELNAAIPKISILNSNLNIHKKRILCNYQTSDLAFTGGMNQA